MINSTRKTTVPLSTKLLMTSAMPARGKVVMTPGSWAPVADMILSYIIATSTEQAKVEVYQWRY
jgi:hypothetical protein